MTDVRKPPKVETAEGYRIECDPTKRHDFLYLFDCEMGNPNGDPDADGAPRVDPETGHGIVTGVALKRRVRNYVALASEYEADDARRDRLGIFIAHRGILNEKIREAHEQSGLPVGKRVQRQVRDAEAAAELAELAGDDLLPSGFSVPTDGSLSYTGELVPRELKAALDGLAAEHALSKKARAAIEGAAREAGRPERSRANTETAGRYMRDHNYDVRMFGAVMQTGLNAGQALGPLQLVDARSLHPVAPMEMTITRTAVTREEESDQKLSTIGRRYVIPYGLYLARGFFTHHYARETGADADDLALFWDALAKMWELDRSASRGMMSARGLLVFTHDHPFGDAPAHKLFSRLKVEPKDDAASPRSFDDFGVTVDDSDLPKGVTLTRP